MAYFEVPSFLYIFVLINYSFAVLNNPGNKNEDVDVERALCVGGDVAGGNLETLEPIVIATENISSVKVKKVAGIIEDKASIISNKYELPLQSSNNQGLMFMPTNSFHSFESQLPQVFSPKSRQLNLFPQSENTVGRKRLQFGAHYTSTFSPYRDHRAESINVATIPTSLESYGPPINTLVRPYFSSLSFPTGLPNDHHEPSNTNQIPSKIRNHLSPNLRIFAPPSPPDIKYDGWKPILGYYSSPNHLSVSEKAKNEHSISSLSSNDYSIQSTGQEVSHSSRQLSDFPTAIPSNSYGEPINNPEDHNLKQSVRQSQIADGLPPPLIPEQEPFHVNQGPTTMVFSTGAPPVANIINDSHHQKRLEPLQLPNIKDSSGLFPSQSSIAQLNNNNSGFHAETDLLSQRLPVFSNGLFTTFSNPVGDTASSYLAPPPSSYSPFGLYPSSRRPSYLVDPLKEPVRVTNNNRIRNTPKFMHLGNRGTFRSQSTLESVPLMSDFIPPESSYYSKFRQKLILQLPSNSVHDNFQLPSTTPTSSSIHDLTFGSNFVKDYQYSTSLDSYEASSSNQPALTDLLDHLQFGGSTNQPNETDHANSGRAALSISQVLSSESVLSDSVDIDGSKDSYTLQIGAADGRREMENIDGGIKHDEILSQGLLHDIIMAIEQSGDDANFGIPNNSAVQSLEESHEQSVVLPSPFSSRYSSFHTDGVHNDQDTGRLSEKLVRSSTSHDRGRNELLLNGNTAALFSHNHYEEPINTF